MSNQELRPLGTFLHDSAHIFFTMLFPDVLDFLGQGESKSPYVRNLGSQNRAKKV